MLRDISLTLHKGEILGIGGLSESGMHELGKALFGASYDRSGSVSLGDGTAVDSIQTAIRHGIAYASKDRDSESLILPQSIQDNICLPSIDSLKTGPVSYTHLDVYKRQEQIPAGDVIFQMRVAEI